MKSTMNEDNYPKNESHLDNREASEQPHPLPATDDETKRDVQKDNNPKPDIAIKTPKWY